MADVKWIKIATNIFDNRKIKLLEVMPEGDSLIVIWLKLLSLAGTVNDNGSVYFTKDLPYTSQMLAAAFNRPQTTVNMALETFEKFGMIEIVDDIIHVSNWEKYQNSDGLDKIRQQNRLRQQKRREKLRIECKETKPEKEQKITEDNVTCNDTVTLCHVTDNVTDNVTGHDDVTLRHVTDNVTVTHGHAIEIDKDIDIDKDIEIDRSIDQKKFSNLDYDAQKEILENIRNAWNDLSIYGIARLHILECNTSERGRNLAKRLDTYGINSIVQFVEEIKQSAYLRGDAGYAPVTFNWAVGTDEVYGRIISGYYREWKPKKNDKQANWQGSSFDSELEEKLLDN